MPRTLDTFTGIVIDPLAPRKQDIALEDLAHALSMVCRGSGQLLHFYSVAQHCLNCAHEAAARGYDERLQLACLLHDATEAYLADVISPIKTHLREYLVVEARFEEVVRRRFGLDGLKEDELSKVREIDLAMLSNELPKMLPLHRDDEPTPLASVPDLGERPHAEVEREFLDLARELGAR